MDTHALENIAISQIVFALLRAEIIVAKPYGDCDGGDLLGFASLDDGAKFCRIQAKLRSLLTSGASSSIDIPKRYVNGSFIAILCINTPGAPASLLPMYCFFVADIERWHLNGDNEFVLTFSATNYQDKLRQNVMTTETLARILEMLRRSDAKRELDYFIVLAGNHDIEIVDNVTTEQWRTVYSATDREVLVKMTGPLRKTVIRSKLTGLELSALPCPGNPDDFVYDPASESWKAR